MATGAQGSVRSSLEQSLGPGAKVHWPLGKVETASQSQRRVLTMFSWARAVCWRNWRRLEGECGLQLHAGIGQQPTAIPDAKSGTPATPYDLRNNAKS